MAALPPISNQQTTSQLLQPGYLNAPTTYTAAQTTAPQLDPNLINSLSPTNTIQQLYTAFQPQQQAAESNLSQTLADFGVTGGQAVDAMSALQEQLASAIAPSIASVIQGSQSNQLGAGEFNANAGLQAALNNTGALNQAGQFNASDFNTTNAANVGQFNASQNEQLNAILQQYKDQLAAFDNINSGAQGAGNQNALNYGQDITVSNPLGNIAQPLAGAAGAFASAAAPDLALAPLLA